MRYVAYCTKGLEKVVTEELRTRIKGVQILSEGIKYIVFETNAGHELLTGLRTVDDIGLLVCQFVYPDDFKTIHHSLSGYPGPRFSVTGSIVGTKDKPGDIINNFVLNIQAENKWEYLERDHSQFDIRLFIDHQKGILSIRTTAKPLSQRDYKIASRVGSLKATVAAAMVLLATKNQHSLKIVDTFCGSGTILAEALAQSHIVYGSDINTEAVLFTEKNLLNQEYKIEDKIRQLDATKTNWPVRYFDCAISNLPWDKQIKVKSITSLYEGALWEYRRIVRDDGTVCVLLTKPELFIKLAKTIFPLHMIQAYPIGLLGQTPTIVMLTKSSRNDREL